MQITWSRNCAVLAAGVLLALGPVALIGLDRGPVRTAVAAAISLDPQPGASRKDAARLPTVGAVPVGLAPARSEVGQLLFAPPGDGASRTMLSMADSFGPAVRARPEAPPRAARSSAGRPRTQIARSAKCEGKMPEDAWLQVCG